VLTGLKLSDAVGIKIDELPIKPEKVLEAFKNKGHFAVLNG